MAKQDDTEYPSDEELENWEPEKKPKQASEPVDKEALFKRIQEGIEEEKLWLESDEGKVYQAGEGLEEVDDRTTG